VTQTDAKAPNRSPRFRKVRDQPAVVAPLPRKNGPVVVRFVAQDTDTLSQITVYENDGSRWRLVGDGTQARTVGNGQAGIATVPSTTGDKRKLFEFFTAHLTEPKGKTLGSVLCRVARVLLASSLDPVVSVFVVKSALSEKFVGQLAELLPRCEGKPSLVAIEPVAVRTICGCKTPRRSASARCPTGEA
jgi:hypothetical protein